MIPVADRIAIGDPYNDLRHIVRDVLDHPRDYRWSVHGIGMLRTYLDDTHDWRLNLWHPVLLNPGISTMHTHPWPFTSYVLAGRLRNTRFDRCTKNSVGAELFNEGKITCGTHVQGSSTDQGGTVFPGLNGPPTIVPLHRRTPETYGPNETYTQLPPEIHDTNAFAGSITVIRRGEMTEGCEASVFWPVGQEWGDASREFNWEDADATLAAAIRQLEIAEENGA